MARSRFSPRNIFYSLLGATALGVGIYVLWRRAMRPKPMAESAAVTEPSTLRPARAPRRLRRGKNVPAAELQPPLL